MKVPFKLFNLLLCFMDLLCKAAFLFLQDSTCLSAFWQYHLDQSMLFLRLSICCSFS
ncbi:hypothetical protein L873DRAFT_1814156 [Choiromyces venosus 120613-1]|uniref:Uncharacterized protein n=1 Tax=Choiromyces venosus 120613-1 TaxID=1336337 RepID=A0A3N4JL47_9PEZI|nr:hypothetical protein L873DRAFT_1814156 [Choiromyces venosus 120613-1]